MVYIFALLRLCTIAELQSKGPSLLDHLTFLHCRRALSYVTNVKQCGSLGARPQLDLSTIPAVHTHSAKHMGQPGKQPSQPLSGQPTTHCKSDQRQLCDRFAAQARFLNNSSGWQASAASSQQSVQPLASRPPQQGVNSAVSPDSRCAQEGQLAELRAVPAAGQGFIEQADQARPTVLAFSPSGRLGKAPSLQAAVSSRDGSTSDFSRNRVLSKQASGMGMQPQYQQQKLPAVQRSPAQQAQSDSEAGSDTQSHVGSYTGSDSEAESQPVQQTPKPQRITAVPSITKSRSIWRQSSSQKLTRSTTDLAA